MASVQVRRAELDDSEQIESLLEEKEDFVEAFGEFDVGNLM